MKLPVSLPSSDRLYPLLSGARRLWRNRGITALVVFSLAIGIGANTAIFTLVDAVFLQPVLLGDPDRVVAINTEDEKNANIYALSYPNFADLQSSAKTFESMTLMAWTAARLTSDNVAKDVRAILATPEYFDVAAVRPQLGETFHGPFDAAAPPVVLSHSAWESLFRRDPAVVGRRIALNQAPFTVAGVMPPNFRGFDHMGSAELWVPFPAGTVLLERPTWVNARRALMWLAYGRLKPGVTLEQAAAEAGQIGKQLAAAYPDTNSQRSFRVSSLDDSSAGIAMRHRMLTAAATLMCATLLVLLIAVANVCNALLSRAAVRRREMAVRVALGATPRHLLSDVLWESLLLVIAGGGAGLLLGIVGRDILWRLRPENLAADAFMLGMNLRIVAFAFVLSVLAGILANILPAWQTYRGDLNTELRERGDSLVPRFHVRELLVVSQVALSAIALVGADLFIKSLRNAQQVDPGFDTRNVTAFQVKPRQLGIHRPRDVFEFYAGIQTAVSRVDGVRSVSLASDTLIGHPELRRTVYVGSDRREAGIVRINMIGVRYFETTDILILRGRSFTLEDRSSRPLVAILNEAAAQEYFPGQSALGKKLRLFGDHMDREVIGIARQTQAGGLFGDHPEPLIYIPMLEELTNQAHIFVRTAGDPAALTPALIKAIRSFRPDLTDVALEPLSKRIDAELWVPRTAALLLSCFGLMALLLAAVGVYGITAHLVARRTGEIGVRMAMGASPIDVTELILKQCVTLILPGLAAGLAAAFLLARVFQNLLFHVNENDIEPYLVTALVLAAVALLASYLPVRRATRIEPLSALRQE